MAETVTGNQDYARTLREDARAERIESLCEKTASEIREVRNEMKYLSTKFDRISTISLTAVVGFWTVLAIAVLISAISMSFRKIYQPSITAEEVKRITEQAVKEAIERRLSGGESK